MIPFRIEDREGYVRVEAVGPFDLADLQHLARAMREHARPEGVLRVLFVDHGRSIVRSAYQEHGVVTCDSGLPFPMIRIGDQVRVAPNHVCMTAAMYDKYYVVNGGTRVLAEWDRVNGW